MKTVFVRELKPLLDALAERMDLYIPKKSEDYYVFSKYDPVAAVDLNNIRACTPVKEFLFPLRELAAVFPEPVEPPEIKPFAVFGLKDCDLRSIEVLDKVFAEEEFEDPFYIKRRKNMFIVASDCSDPAESCICNVLEGKPYATSGFDLNVSKVRDGFVIETGSDKGEEFVEKHSQLFSDAPATLLSQRDEERAKTQKQLEQQNAELSFGRPVKEVVENGEESDVFDQEARTCIECQACTRICPTCHCFYLYDTSQKDYFSKMKMWDSCMRMAYAQVAGGANPHKILGDRLKHRLMHKFVYFLDRYGLKMCVGCGRCIDAEAGGVDLRVVLKKLNEELKDKQKAKVAK
ncbi:MAG TPA: 4Fe-4S dicluster domain-containing protein [Sedimentisphaerales bacterium]|nr:4Fe-4S dicluster domain-containing protein [Sedimentisphaerales bacterium]